MTVMKLSDTELLAVTSLKSPAATMVTHADFRSLGADLNKVWIAPTTTDRDRKELLRTLVEEVIVTVDRPERRAHLTLRWRGGTLTELDLSLPRSQPRGYHTDEDTISLLRRLTAHYSDNVIASGVYLK
jgi:hypothetical protein